MENQSVVKNKSETLGEVREIIVKNKGQITIPVKVRKKYKIDEGSRLEMVQKEEGILLKPKKSFWDMLGAYSEYGTPEEVKKELDELRREDDRE